MRVLRRHGDLALALVVAVAVAVEIAAWSGRTSWLAVPVAAASGLVLAVRRRAPVAAFVVVFVCNVAIVNDLAPQFQRNSVFLTVIFLIGLYSIGAHAVRVEAWWGLALVAATVVANTVQDSGSLVTLVTFYIFFCGVPWGVGVVVRLRVERTAELDRRRTELEAEARRAVGEERTRLARELHDVVSHAIAVTVLQARGAAALVGRDDDACRRALRAIEQTNVAALADMRRLLALLRTDGGGRDEPAPGLHDLDRLVEQVRASGLPVGVCVVGEPLPLPPGLDLSAYRIVQEALTNVLQHAGPGATAAVRITYDAAEVAVAVIDVGARPAVTGSPDTVGHGLVGIRERVAVAGGTVELGPTADGYAVRVRLPYLPDGSLVTT